MRKPIICFEGPSGIGKTTMALQFAETSTIIPEVNLLFERPQNASPYWYHERQVERYQRASSSSKISILDGDVFQPIWYNWVCNYPSNFLPKEKTHNFYRQMLHAGQIAFPDLFIIFHADVEELYKRKENDQNRQRRNFEKHLKIIEPLKGYYKFLEEETEMEMKFINYQDFESAKIEVLQAIEKAFVKNKNDLNLFKQIEEWISHHEAPILK